MNVYMNVILCILTGFVLYMSVKLRTDRFSSFYFVIHSFSWAVLKARKPAMGAEKHCILLGPLERIQIK